MARRHASVVLAAIVVIARLLSSGTAAARTTTEETVRAELGHHHTPSRKVRSQGGAHARVAARDQTLDAWLASMPTVFEEPPRTLVPPATLPAAAPIATLPPPVTRARAPPR